MSGKNKKQFGIWMDSQHATILGREQISTGDFVILAHEKNDGHGGNSNENTGNNSEKTLQHKFFKLISAHMQNVEELHVTGTGQVQEQFISYLSDTPQFKNTESNHSTSNKMSDDKLIEFMKGKFN